MKRRVGFQFFLKVWNSILSQFSTSLEFHDSNILIKISFLPCFRQSLKSMDFTSRQFEKRIP